MEALRVSASDIDALRYFMANDEGDLDQLIKQLRRELPQTEPMRVGTALHTALENADTGCFTELSADGYTFEFTGSNEIDIPDIRELKATKDIEIGDCLVTLVGKVDGCHGRRIDDHKFTSRYDAEKFFSSYQWRIYLHIFNADIFRWNAFEGRELMANRYLIYNVHQLQMYRYPGMAEDIEKELARFVSFARTHLPEKFTMMGHDQMMGLAMEPQEFRV